MKILIIFLIAMCIVMPAVAVELEETYLGKVTKADKATGALDVKISAKWDGKQFAPVDPVTVSGTSSFDLLFDNIKQSDEVVGTLMGGGKWIAVGLVGSKQSTQKQLLWMAGDPNAMVSPFVGSYRVSYNATPDCDSCKGSVCYARSVDVMVTTIGYNANGKEYMVAEVGTQTMRPADRWNTEKKENQQYLEILFIKGEAPASACPESEMMVGPQAVSEFFIRLVNVASVVPTTETASAVATTPPTVGQTTAVPATAATPAPTPTSTPGFGMVAAMLGCAAALVVIRR